jgi:hypothetical protein
MLSFILKFRLSCYVVDRWERKGEQKHTQRNIVLVYTSMLFDILINQPELNRFTVGEISWQNEETILGWVLGLYGILGREQVLSQFFLTEAI